MGVSTIVSIFFRAIELFISLIFKNENGKREWTKKEFIPKEQKD